jgi:hypothetical protein
MSESANVGLDWNGVDAGPLHLGEGEDKGSIISLALFAQSIELPGRRRPLCPTHPGAHPAAHR